MSAPAFAWAFEKGHELGLTSSQLLLLLYMADQANGQGWFFTGLPRLAKYSRLCVRTIRDLIPELAKLGLIRAEQRPGKSTIYHVLRQPQGEAATAAQAVTARQVNGAAQAATTTNTPAATAVANGTHPGNPASAPRQSTTLTPAATAHDPSSTQEEDPRARERAQGEGSKDREAGKQDGPSPPPPNSPPPKAPLLGATPGGGGGQAMVTPRPSDAWLDKPSADDALPKARAAHLDTEQGDVITADVPDPDGPPPPGAFKALIDSIASGFQNNYPPREAQRSPSEQADAVTEKPHPKAYHPNPEQLAALRKQAGIRATANA